MTGLTPTEYRAMEERIAAHLGWSDLRETRYYEESRLYDGFVNARKGTDSHGHDDILPHWSTNVGDALDLFTDLPNDLTPRLVRLLSPRGDSMARTWKGSILNNSDMNEIQAESDSPALAICLAWLAYKDAEASNE